MALTEPQRRALQFLADHAYATPSEIGVAITGGLKRSGYPMKAQGLGRIGGAMAWRLMRLGLAGNASARRAGFPAYEITGAGRRALAAAPEAEGRGDA